MSEEVINKLIDDIIELIIGDMCCHHEEDRDEDGVHTSVEYSLNNETKLRGMIRELIEQSKETEAQKFMKNYLETPEGKK